LLVLQLLLFKTYPHANAKQRKTKKWPNNDKIEIRWLHEHLHNTQYILCIKYIKFKAKYSLLIASNCKCCILMTPRALAQYSMHPVCKVHLKANDSTCILIACNCKCYCVICTIYQVKFILETQNKYK
jgi:hypothetical protein